MTSRLPPERLEHLLERINVDQSHGERRPHKPLLLLYAIARLLTRGQRKVSFREAEGDLTQLLRRFAPPSRAIRPGYPWWRLQNDGLWELNDVDGIATNRSGDPSIGDLRRTSGGLPDRIATQLTSDPPLARRVVRTLLDAHFTPSWHGAVLDAVGFDAAFEGSDDAAAPPLAVELVRESIQRWQRPSAFSKQVLRAYGHRCAVTGYRADLEGVPIALEAAHLHWHCKGGPAKVENGLALQPTLHRLLDYGAWTLDDDRCVVVSSHVTEDAAHALLAPLRGKRVRDPEQGHAPLKVEHIRWHREAKLGGVFRG